MSATNRGTERVKADFYPTPVNVIKNFLDVHKLKEGTILEPCAGNGHFIKTLREVGYENHVLAYELREEENVNLYNSGANYVEHGDFLKRTEKNISVKTVITNPPYSHAEEFVRKCKELYPNAEIIMLLRLAFLESKKRFEFWQQHKVNKLYILSQRPSFTGKGTDATAYAWFVWDGSEKQEVKVI